MKPRAIAISGAAFSGKTSLAIRLSSQLNAQYVSLPDLVVQLLPKTRSDPDSVERSLQLLDRETGGRWLADALAGQLLKAGRPEVVVIDGIRRTDQANFLRQGGWRVTHVHLEASAEEVAKRLGAPATRSKKPISLGGAPKELRSLAKLADVV